MSCLRVLRNAAAGADGVANVSGGGGVAGAVIISANVCHVDGSGPNIPPPSAVVFAADVLKYRGSVGVVHGFGAFGFWLGRLTGRLKSKPARHSPRPERGSFIPALLVTWNQNSPEA